MNQPVKIGLIGFGAVGQGLYDVLKQSKATKAVISKICVKNRSKRRSLPEGSFSFDPEDLLGDPSLSLIVELIDDSEAAYGFVKTALQRGRSVVSGNKKMLAHHLPELIDLQKSTGCGLLYDASACGSIPIIRNLEEYYDNDLLQSITGILNGSSNYILSKMSRGGISYREALHQAQELGFAEADPSLDVDGSDALFKLVIITVHAFGIYVHPGEIFHTGISRISTNDIQYAAEKGKKIKLVGQVRKNGEQALSMYVMPRMLPPGKYIYNVEDEFNGVVIKGAFSDKQFMFGRGAGGHPTGSAVLSDITASGYGYRYEYKKMKMNPGIRFSNEEIISVYLRFNGDSDLNVLKFEEISEKYDSADLRYVTGKISLGELFRCRKELRDRKLFLAEV